ncbi:MAG: orotidine 5'-phosphate decarboxylase, partial [Leptospiraceae bacterium]|nr:orotidine 5'-phosphate decarboxylase [Leptospiraceae bacterium]
MSFYEKINLQKEKLNSFLCIGLDPEEEKLPESIKNSPTPLLDFCKG